MGYPSYPNPMGFGSPYGMMMPPFGMGMPGMSGMSSMSGMPGMPGMDPQQMQVSFLSFSDSAGDRPNVYSVTFSYRCKPCTLRKQLTSPLYKANNSHRLPVRLSRKARRRRRRSRKARRRRRRSRKRRVRRVNNNTPKVSAPHIRGTVSPVCQVFKARRRPIMGTGTG
jgi:hypothetical protein